MTPSRWKTLFLSIITLCTIGYSCYTLWLYWGYQRLDRELPFEKIEWSVYPESEETNLFKASYHYRFNDTSYSGEYLFKKPVFINILGATHALTDFSKKVTTTWISSENPQISSLEKAFPLKECVYSVTLWAILLYFLLLPVYCRYRYGKV